MINTPFILITWLSILAKGMDDGSGGLGRHDRFLMGMIL
jgi:hypothetical protein